MQSWWVLSFELDTHGTPATHWALLNVKGPEKLPKVDGGWVSDGKSHIGDEDKQVQNMLKGCQK